MDYPDGEDHPCPKCGRPTPNERFNMIHTLLCTSCTPQKSRPKGCVEYGHKTAGILIICDTEAEYQNLKKPANRRR